MSATWSAMRSSAYTPAVLLGASLLLACASKPEAAPACGELVSMVVDFLEPHQKRPYFVICGGDAYGSDRHLVDRGAVDVECRSSGCWRWVIEPRNADEGTLKGTGRPPENTGLPGGYIVAQIKWSLVEGKLTIVKAAIVERS